MTAGKLVGIRTSMRKFEVANSMLDVEVCSVAKVMPCTLNRQVMMALLSRGLDEMVLWNKYQEFVSQLDYLLEGGEEALMVRFSHFLPPLVLLCRVLRGRSNALHENRIM